MFINLYLYLFYVEGFDILIVIVASSAYMKLALVVERWTLNAVIDSDWSMGRPEVVVTINISFSLT